MTPDFKIDWGEKYSKAKYPTRAKREVHTFDIKEFVKSEKKKKLLEMMNAADTDADMQNLSNSPWFASRPLLNGKFQKCQPVMNNPFKRYWKNRPNEDCFRVIMILM